MVTPAKVPPMEARAVIERVHDVLLVRTGHDEPYPGVWTFPGGPVPAGTSPEITLRSHLRKRLGVQVELFVGQPPFLFDVQGTTVTFRYYICGILAGEPHAKYWPECQWVHKARLREFDFEPQAKRVADWIMEGLE
jgi:ADP-ribose pyrophosphatase YjhB (NUDIX family)